MFFIYLNFKFSEMKGRVLFKKRKCENIQTIFFFSCIRVFFNEKDNLYLNEISHQFPSELNDGITYYISIHIVFFSRTSWSFCSNLVYTFLIVNEVKYFTGKLPQGNRINCAEKPWLLKHITTGIPSA